VAQEALTNTLKHAGPARAELTVRYGADSLEITASDTGSGGAATARNGTGHGLVGMRERVSLFGGHLEAGAGPGGGFRVAARFPLHGGPA
jgi:signal transduction histidine kinase